jgi:hypothetical protein
LEEHMSHPARWKYMVIIHKEQGDKTKPYKVIEGPPFTPTGPYLFEAAESEAAKVWVEQKEYEGGYAKEKPRRLN